jgi:hypothetical protein
MGRNGVEYLGCGNWIDEIEIEQVWRLDGKQRYHIFLFSLVGFSLLGCYKWDVMRMTIYQHIITQRVCIAW